jgi:hypothetical protein
MTSELYNVDNYTDAQLYDILDMNSPTDRELEAKILHLIRKYTAMQTVAGNQLTKFFEDIYKRFFHSPEEEEEEVEGFKNKKDNSLEKQNITATQNFDYAQDKLQINPLIKQTITRVISIDSQYRDVTTSPYTTNFTFDLSEPLRDVVSLKLYSVQIPYTWYTIAKSYGSNFFYLKPTNSTISNDPKYSYQIAISPGTYSPTQLVSAINKSFQDLSNSVAADVNFNGQPLLSYNNNTSISICKTPSMKIIILSLFPIQPLETLLQVIWDLQIKPIIRTLSHPTRRYIRPVLYHLLERIRKITLSMH